MSVCVCVCLTILRIEICLSLSVCVCVCGAIHSFNKHTRTPQTLWQGPIEQSPADTKQYRALTLANGLRVLLVSDPGKEEARAHAAKQAWMAKWKDSTGHGRWAIDCRPVPNSIHRHHWCSISPMIPPPSIDRFQHIITVIG